MSGLGQGRGALGLSHATVVLQWLAGFHATYWKTAGELADIPPLLWQ